MKRIHHERIGLSLVLVVILLSITAPTASAAIPRSDSATAGASTAGPTLKQGDNPGGGNSNPGNGGSNDGGRNGQSSGSQNNGQSSGSQNNGQSSGSQNNGQSSGDGSNGQSSGNQGKASDQSKSSNPEKSSNNDNTGTNAGNGNADNTANGNADNTANGNAPQDAGQSGSTTGVPGVGQDGKPITPAEKGGPGAVTEKGPGKTVVAVQARDRGANGTNAKVRVEPSQANTTVQVDFTAGPPSQAETPKSGNFSVGSPGQQPTPGSETSAGKGVSLDSMSVTVKDKEPVGLDVSTNDRKFDSTPSFTPGEKNGTESLGYVRVEHTVNDTNIEQATFSFGVDKQRLQAAGTDPENVVLFRYHNGSWNEVSTRLVTETPTQYRYRATSPGLSEFAVGAQKAVFKIQNALVTASQLTVGDTTDVRVNVHNSGGASGEYRVQLLLHATVVDTKRLTVAANGSRLAVFERRFSEGGDYTVRVNNVTAGEVSVVDPATDAATTADGTTSDPTTKSTTGTGPGFGVAATLLALAAFLFVHRRGT